MIALPGAPRGERTPGCLFKRREMQGKQEDRNIVRFCLAYPLSAFGHEFMVFVMNVHIHDLTGSARNKYGLTGFLRHE